MNALLAPVRQWINTGLGFLYPERCQLCESEPATAADGFVGRRCGSQVRFIQPPFCRRCGLPFPGDLDGPFECANCRELDLHFRYARSAVVARGVALEAIHRFKYDRDLWFENFLASLLVRAAAPVLRRENWTLIVPVPLHPVKERQREFNQADRLAGHLAVALNIPVNADRLRRVTATRTQTLLTRRERAANMRGAFALRPGRALESERVVLVDDVFTTGATTSACARVLRDAGAGDVCVWTVARGL